MKITGNEPAYPTTVDHENGQPRMAYQNGNTTAAYSGLSIRQQFAMAAMQGIMAGMGTDIQTFKMQMEYFAERYPNDTMYVACAKESVGAADALIAELNRTEEQK